MQTCTQAEVYELVQGAGCFDAASHSAIRHTMPTNTAAHLEVHEGPVNTSLMYSSTGLVHRPTGLEAAGADCIGELP